MLRPARVAPLAALLAPAAAAAQTPPAPPAPRAVRPGVHVGLNATLAVDLSVGRYAYGGVATQLTGLGALADPQRNYVVSALLFGGVALPLLERAALRLTADVTPAVGYLYAAPVSLVTAGLLAGLRLVHRSGFTASLRLPVIGYAGSPNAQRGSVLYYYIAAVPTVPLVTVGYTF